MTRSPETELILERLRQLQPGESLPLERLSGQVGFDVTKHRGKVYNAREIINREQQGKIDLKKGVLTRLADEECVTSKREHFQTKVKNTARRASNMLYGVNYQALPERLQTEHNTGLAMFGAIRAAVSASAVLKLPPKEKTSKFLPSDAVSGLLK